MTDLETIDGQALELAARLGIDRACYCRSDAGGDLVDRMIRTWSVEDRHHHAMVTFGILGPLTVRIGDSIVQTIAPKLRVILVHLLLQNNRIVPVEELIDSVWGNSPPRQARNAIQTYVMRLRQALHVAGDLVGTEPPGYLIAVDDDAIDLGRFRNLVTRSRAAAAGGLLEEAVEQLRAALALWRGRPLADTPSLVLQQEQVPRLVEEQLHAIETRIDLDLRLGRHADLVSELQALTTRHPLHEGLWSQFMLALYRSGRQADALNTYHRLAALLRDELAVDPCELVQQLYQRILVRDNELDVLAPAKPAAGTDAWPPPFQTPADVVDFVGRHELVERIGELLSPAASSVRAVPGVALSGLPGVGKTALAIHVAHRMRAAFPDGQLYVDMRGYSRDRPMPPTGALSRFLRALGIAAGEMPIEMDMQSALLRSLLSHRRVLIILDNVVSPDQVRPMLPGTPGSAVMVTSRRILAGLTAINGMGQVPVGPITVEEATAMLSTILGNRVASEPDAAVNLADMCGNLPLALRIAAANLAARPDHSIAAYVTELSSEGRLSALTIDGDDTAAVDASFELSYRLLAPEAARLFRLLGLIPGPGFDSWAAANIASVDPSTASRLLGRLAAANLIQYRQDGYSFHDLIREYARGRSATEDGGAEPRNVRRLFAFYLHTADEAVQVAYPSVARSALPIPDAGMVKPSLSEPTAATHWLNREIVNIEAIVCSRAALEHSLPVWRLAEAVLGHLDHLRLDASWHMICRTAWEAAVRAGDRIGEAAMCRALGRLHYLQANYHLAEQFYVQATDAYRELGDPVGEARTLVELSGVAGSLSQYAKFNRCLYPALAAFRAAGDRESEAETLTNLGTSLVQLGKSKKALKFLSSASALAARLGLGHIRIRVEAAIAMNDLYRGALDDAEVRLRAALEASRELDYRTMEAQMLRNIAEVQLEQGSPESAYRLAEEALAVAEKNKATWNRFGSWVTLGQAALALGDVRGATEHFSHAHDERMAQVQFWYWFAILGLAACRRLGGDAAGSLDLSRGALADPRPRARSQAHLEAAKAYLTLGDGASGEAYARKALEIAEAAGFQPDRARALHLLDDVRSAVSGAG